MGRFLLLHTCMSMCTRPPSPPPTPTPPRTRTRPGRSNAAPSAVAARRSRLVNGRHIYNRRTACAYTPAHTAQTGRLLLLSSLYRRDCRVVTLVHARRCFTLKRAPDGSDTNIRFCGGGGGGGTNPDSNMHQVGGNSRGTVRVWPLRSGHNDSGSSLDVTDFLTDKNKWSHSCLGENGHHPPLCMPVKRSFSTVSS